MTERRAARPRVAPHPEELGPPGAAPSPAGVWARAGSRWRVTCKTAVSVPSRRNLGAAAAPVAPGHIPGRETAGAGDGRALYLLRSLLRVSCGGCAPSPSRGWQGRPSTSSAASARRSRWLRRGASLWLCRISPRRHDDTERVLASLPPLSAVLGSSTLWPVSKPAVSLLASEHSVRLRDVVPGRGVCSAPGRRLPAAARGQLRCSSRRPSAAAGGLSGASTCAALSRTPSSRGIFAGLRVRCAPSSLRRSGSSSRRRLALGEPPPPAALPPCARFPGRR